MRSGRLRKERTETELLRDALAGKREAYGEIFKLHRERAYGLAYQYTHNKDDALDVVQDAFIRAYLNLRKFDLNRDFGPWLLTIVRNLSIDLIRKRNRTQGEELPPTLPARNQVKADRQVLKGEVWQALAEMPSAHREIIFLKDYQGHSYAEIAEILSIPLGTVMSRLHHARKKLGELVRERRTSHAV